MYQYMICICIQYVSTINGWWMYDEWMMCLYCKGWRFKTLRNDGPRGREANHHVFSGSMFKPSFSRFMVVNLSVFFLHMLNQNASFMNFTGDKWWLDQPKTKPSNLFFEKMLGEVGCFLLTSPTDLHFKRSYRDDCRSSRGTAIRMRTSANHGWFPPEIFRLFPPGFFEKEPVIFQSHLHDFGFKILIFRAVTSSESQFFPPIHGNVG